MIYEANTAVTYFNAKEKKVGERFAENEPASGNNYTNASGKVRQVTRIMYPIGYMNEQTVFDPETPKHAQGYHTPCAKEPGKYAKVWFIEDGEHGGCTSVEWIEWLGATWVSDPVPEQPEDPVVAKKKAAILQKVMNAEDKAEGDAVVEKEVEKRVAKRTRKKVDGKGKK